MKLPEGFRYATTYAGIRKDKRDDLALIVSRPAASAAAVFTQNLVQAAPVLIGRKHLAESKGTVSAVLINAGNANCATRTGERVAVACCRAVGHQLRLPINQVIPSSTGVIGVELDPNLIVNSVPRLIGALRQDGFDAASRAIMTTDLAPKTAFAEVGVGDSIVRIAGMAKGSGMIHPQMATTLAFVMTDAAVRPAMLRAMLKRATARSFNCLSVDGDTSTNDTLLLLANGASGVKVARPEELEEPLTLLLQDLSQQIARDGEGAKRFVTIDVSGAATNDQAVRIARAIANSPLFKTAIAGADPNWGRVLSAAGNAGVNFNPRAVDIHMQGTLVCKAGLAADFDEAELKRKLDAKDVNVRFLIKGRDAGRARFWTCDLTEDYIRINASYRT
ncbi:MAG: bifunctional glutamate N-acetyltransferase/amino-acid acetyltransferase ArgJ [Bryobacterales bacterium]|nr:bifunctional glutamate N-acetyltransferase/amino-acid acetyltransferase ArgJ [Bryobacterales bacterium]